MGNMKTLDEFFSETNEKEMIKKEKTYISRTRKEYTLEDLPLEIRKNPKKYVERIKALELSEDQKKLVELIENGAKLKIQKGKKREEKVIIEPYSPYLLLVLKKSIRRGHSDKQR
jgi:methyl coenzyme M reductase beta subunit